METVQIKCGSCNRVMAISVEHLGSQVHCPHCEAIVQAPPRPPSKAPEIGGDNDNGETESIFAGPEVTDDIFNSGPSGPLVEMPLERIAAPPPQPRESDATVYAPPPGAKEPVFFEEKRKDESTQAIPARAPAWTDASTVYEESPGDNASLAALQPRRPERKSALAPILLIFLVPYAILATLVIAYLLMNQARVINPLEILPDPKPKDGGPRTTRVAHDSILPGQLKTNLNLPLQIGILQVTPVKVQWNSDDQLVLHLKMKNMSKDVVFNPISYEFLKFAPGVNASPPYSYLDWKEKKLYGGDPEWLRGPEGKEIFGGDIEPGQEELIRIYTVSKYKNDVKRIAASNETLVWRVQVRRGFVEVRGNQVSATAVVGVEFNAKAIEKESQAPL